MISEWSRWSQDYIRGHSLSPGSKGTEIGCSYTARFSGMLGGGMEWGGAVKSEAGGKSKRHRNGPQLR